jgi:hypothetical protein
VEAVYTPPGGPSLTFRTVPPRSRLGRVVFGRCFSNGGGLKKLCYVKVRITLKDGGVYREDLGYGVMDNARTKAQALEKAKKEATTWVCRVPAEKKPLPLASLPAPLLAPSVALPGLSLLWSHPNLGLGLLSLPAGPRLMVFCSASTAAWNVKSSDF